MFFSILIIILLIIYLYLDSKLRSYFESSNKGEVGPFSEKFLSMTQKISNLFKNKIGFSNLIFVFGTISIISLSIVDYYIHSIGSVLTGIGMILLFLSIFISASISGKTWVYFLYKWASKSKHLPNILIKDLMYELFFIIPALLFSLFLWALLTLLSKPLSPINLRIIFYVLPMFAVFWVYRINDYKKSDDLLLNIRRAIMYILVALINFKLNDPYSQLTRNVESSEFKLDNMILNIDTVIFITLDRLGKTIIEILREALRKKKNEAEEII